MNTKNVAVLLMVSAMLIPTLVHGVCNAQSISFCSEIEAATKCTKPCECMQSYGRCLKDDGCAKDLYGEYLYACWQECKSAGNNRCPHPPGIRREDMSAVLSGVLRERAVDGTVVATIVNTGYTG
jgi:hypothetical protein